jgi:Pyridoxamine 5'-phosphate oxidase
MSWEELDRQAPQIARLGKRLLEERGLAFLATVRRDGSPRLHPVSPVICQGELMMGVIDRSPKSRDLLRDGRCVLHALPGPGHAEFWVEALAEPVPPEAALDWAKREPQLALPSGDTLFRLRITGAHATIFAPDGNGRPVPDRRHWRRQPERAGTTAASHGG